MNVETKTCVKIGATIFMLYLCIHYWSAAAGLFGAVLGAASPLLIGCVIAYIINILMSFYERHFFGIVFRTPAKKRNVVYYCFF